MANYYNIITYLYDDLKHLKYYCTTRIIALFVDIISHYSIGVLPVPSLEYYK